MLAIATLALVCGARSAHAKGGSVNVTTTASFTGSTFT
jgi:hypothetical protein